MSTQDTEKTTTKTKAAAKPRKPSTKKKAVAPPAPTHADIALLAEKFWVERGRPHGSAEIDWLRAEQELLGQAS
jgi:hypothetical protein